MISDKKALSSTKYRTKTLYTAQRAEKRDIREYEILNKNLHTAQYTGQKQFIRHNIPDKRFIQQLKRDKNALHGTI